MTTVRDQRQHAVTSRATRSWCTCRTRCRWTTRCTRHGWPLPALSRSSTGHPDGRGTDAAGLGDALLLATLIAANDAPTRWPTSRKDHPPEDHCVSHDAVFAGRCRAREQVSIRRSPGAGGPPPDDELDRGGDGDGNEGADHPEQGSSEQDALRRAGQVVGGAPWRRYSSGTPDAPPTCRT